MVIPTSSYDTLLNNYQNSLDWMQEIGVKISTGRTNHYSSIVKYWNNEFRTASDSDAKKILPDFVSSIFEIRDFIEIYQAFKDTPKSELTSITEKLQKGVNGPIHSIEETSKSTTARNFIFEALVAARSHRPDNGVKAILDAVSDTGIYIEDKKIWIECKRLTSIQKIEANTRKACKQLESILKKNSGSGDRGIVALDITKILNPGDKIYVKKNDHELIRTIRGIMDKFIWEYSAQWQKVYRNKNRKIIGTLIRFSFMASSEDRDLMVRAVQWAVNPRLGVSTSTENMLKSLSKSLNKIS